MRAARYERTGPAREVLEITEVPTPEPGPGEVRVKLATSGINPSDVKSRGGMMGSRLAFPFVIPHSDGAGMIDAVGEGVSTNRVGERVWTWNAAWKRPFGTAAEFVVLPSEQAVFLPENIDFASGACLGIPALTALYALQVDGGVRDKTVLVTGGAGAVGHYAVQMARLLGARKVLSTVSGPEKAELARAAGAEVVINYRTEDVAARVREETDGVGVHRIIEVDLAANLASDIDAIRADGELVPYGSGARDVAFPFGPMIMKNIGVRFFIVYNLSAQARAHALSTLTAMLETGQLMHNLAGRLPLDRIVEGHELVEQGRAMGNVVLEL